MAHLVQGYIVVVVFLMPPPPPQKVICQMNCLLKLLWASGAQLAYYAEIETYFVVSEA